MNKYLSFDVGGTMIKYALFDHSGNLIYLNKVSTPKTYNLFKETLNVILDQYRSQIIGVAFSVPGRIDTESNTIYGGGSLEFNHKKTITDIVNIGNLEFAIENDAKAATLAEMWRGNLKDVKNGGSIVLGTGIGGGIVLDGALYRGSNYAASELSICTPGYGLDAMNLAGLQGSAVFMIQKINQLFKHEDEFDGLKAFEYIIEGESEAVEIFNDFCKTIAYIIFNMQVTLDLQKIVIGGGISNQPIVELTIKKYVEELYDMHPVIKNTIFIPKVESSVFKSEANLYGALYNLFLKFESKI